MPIRCSETLASDRPALRPGGEPATRWLDRFLQVSVVVLLLPALLAVAATTGPLIAARKLAGVGRPGRAPLSARRVLPYNLARVGGRRTPEL